MPNDCLIFAADEHSAARGGRSGLGLRAAARNPRSLRARFQPVGLPGRRGRSTKPEAAFLLHGFSLVEIMFVIAIMLIMAVLIAPAFTSLKSAGDVTSAASTIKGALDQARTYAMANNTYTAVGFAGSIGPGAASVTGQVNIAEFASTDATANGLANGNYVQLGKLVKLDNTHIGDAGVPTNDGTEFESRANVASSYRISMVGTGAYTITTQSVTFNRWIQFNPRGEAVVNGNSSVTQYAEVDVLPTHGARLAVAQDANGKWLGNIVSVQISGYSGNVRIYRR